MKGLWCAAFAGIAGIVLIGFAVNAWLGEDAGRSREGWGDQDARTAELDVRISEIKERLRRREELARNVVGGTMTLFEAAAGMRDLDRAAPDFPWDLFRVWHSGATDEERHCREVIGWVENALIGRPEKTTCVARLEKELADELRRGPLRLPDLLRAVVAPPLPPAPPPVRVAD
jgi:hypothetical protein